MARRKQANIVAALASADAYAKAVAESDKYLTGDAFPFRDYVVIDVHQDWCGPCTVVEPVMRKIFIDLERAEERIKLYTIDQALLREDQRKALPISGCKPLFVIYKQKVVIAKVSGVNAPELEANILDNVPALESDA